MIDALRFAEHPIVNALGWSLLHFVWQGALIGFVAYVVLRVVRPAEASTRYLCAVAALAALLSAPIATFMSLAGDAAELPAMRSIPSATHGSSALVTGSIIADMEANPAATRQLIPTVPILSVREAIPPAAPPWLPLITAAWLFGVTILSVRMLGGWVLTRLLARRAVTAVSPLVEAAARELAKRLALQRGVAILESAAVSVPMVIGWVRPVVLLPAAALAGLTPMQLEAILAHELAHIRRHDYLINLLQSFVETLLFYHPAVWWISAEIRAERENCCDDLAVAVCGDRLVYVSALAELTSIERRAFALAATDGSLVTRIRRILGRPAVARRELPPTWGILALVVLLGGGAGTYEITTAAKDQNPPPAPPTEPAREMIEQDRLEQQADRLREAQESLIQAEEQLRARQSEFAAAQAARDAAIAAMITTEQRRWFELRPPPAPPAPPGPSVPPTPPVAPLVPLPPLVAGTLFGFEFQAPPAPPAPPAVPPSPAPPAPPTPPDRVSTSRSEGNFSWNHNGDRLSVKWTGQFRLSDDERDIGWIEEGARLTISDGTDRIELRGLAGGNIERTFYRSGSKRDFETEGRPVLVNAIARMIRSGMFASDRVARFLKQGGPDAVLAEIDRLQTDSNYVKRAYYSALLKQAELTPAVLNRILERVGKDVTSDYDKSTLLVQVLQEPSAGDEQRVTAARAARSIGSDYDQRKVLTAALASEPLSGAMAAAAIEGASAIDSSYDRGVVLGEIARKNGVTPKTSAAFMATVSGMSSAYEQRKVLSALAGATALPEAVALEAVKAAGAISSAHDRRQTLNAYIGRSDASAKVAGATLGSATTIGSSHDKAEVLLEVVRKGGLTDDTAAQFFAAATTIGSSHDLSRVLQAAAARPGLTDKVMTSLVRAAGSIDNSYDRSRALLAILKTQTLSPTTRQLFLDVAQGISSTHEQNQVLAELVRSERRER